jgi:hypothetical protein
MADKKVVKGEQAEEKNFNAEIFGSDEPEVETPSTSAAPAAGAPATLTQEQLVQLLQSNQAMVQAFSKFLEGQADSGPIRQIHISKAKIKTPWNPTGRPYRVRLDRNTYMNGHQMREAMMTEEEISLFNQLKGGLYHNKRWMVQVREMGEEGSSSEVLLWIPNKTQDDRVRLAKDCMHPSDPKRNGLLAILDRILDEQNALVVATR